MDEPVKIVVVGARSVRQGTGPFIAAGLAKAGADIAAVVGTSEQTAIEAAAGLQRDWGINTTGYASLALALEQVRPTAVALCSPWRYHAEQLQQVAQAGCHCLVEKPLAWPATLAQCDDLTKAFTNKNRLLQQVTQWPTTLGAFAQLHHGLPSRIHSFTMRLSPISIGEDMITDSAPHFVSMLQALTGPGDCEDVAIEKTPEQLVLRCNYLHSSGATAGTLILQTCESRPRPAWYEINGLRADRRVALPQYEQSLVSDEREVGLQDPLHVVTAQFLADIQAGKTTPAVPLLGAHRNLQQLAAAWR